MLPRYYCPPGIARPAHVPAALQGIGLKAGKGPDVAGGGPGGGMVYGPSSYVEGEPGWKPIPGGWWINVTGALPQHLVRFDGNPRIIRWHEVPGALPTHFWNVPALIRPNLRATDDTPRLYVSALDQIYTRAGWQDASDISSLQERLQLLAHNLALSDDPDLEERRLVDLVAEILGLGHHVHPDELIDCGWISESFLLRVIIAAAEIPAAPKDPLDG